MQLNEKFNLSEDTYQEFISRLTFDSNGNLRGFIYCEIEKELDDKQSDLFWSNFGI